MKERLGAVEAYGHSLGPLFQTISFSPFQTVRSLGPLSPAGKAMARALTSHPPLVLHPLKSRGKCTQFVKVSAELRETPSSSPALSVSSDQGEGEGMGASSVATPRSLIHEPPCPLCLKSVGSEGAASFSKHLQLAARSVRRSQCVNISSNAIGNSSQNEGDLRRNQSLQMSRHGGSSAKNHFKRQFSFNGRMGKDLFGTKLFRRTGSSSSSFLKDDPSQPRHRRPHQSSR